MDANCYLVFALYQGAGVEAGNQQIDMPVKGRTIRTLLAVGKERFPSWTYIEVAHKTCCCRQQTKSYALSLAWIDMCAQQEMFHKPHFCETNV